MRRAKRGKVDPGFSHSRPSATRLFCNRPRDQETTGSGDEKGISVASFARGLSHHATLLLCVTRHTRRKRTKTCEKIGALSGSSLPSRGTVVIRPTQAQILKGTVKRTTKTFNFFCNITAKRVKKRCSSFFHPLSILSCNKSGTCRLRKVVVESTSTFCNIHFTRVLRVLPAQGKLVLQEVTNSCS